jgi:GMP synthase-like glutamine amidotransferase
MDLSSRSHPDELLIFPAENPESTLPFHTCQQNDGNEDSMRKNMREDVTNWNEPPPEDPTFLERIVGDSTADDVRCLRFAMLGCEPNVPYGPIDHTAQLFMDLFSKAALATRPKSCWRIAVKTFDVQKFQYPKDQEEWDSFDGVWIPGSFASAYDRKDWIDQLCETIQQEIVSRERKTLGICFGHQILAHSFPDGTATPVPTGARAGRYVMSTTPEGWSMLGGKDSFDLYFTHGDMVEKLPSNAVSLGGSEAIPIQAAAYFRKNEQSSLETLAPASLYAISFQAHPEFATSKDLGVYRTLELIMDAMQQRGSLTMDERLAAGEDAHKSYQAVQEDNVQIMVSVGKLLGWLPPDES